MGTLNNLLSDMRLHYKIRLNFFLLIFKSKNTIVNCISDFNGVFCGVGI